MAPRSRRAGMEDEMRNLKHIGEGYHGFDVEMDMHIFVKTGQEVEVSDGKAAQLFADFPTFWVDVTPVVVIKEEPQFKGKGRK